MSRKTGPSSAQADLVSARAGGMCEAVFVEDCNGRAEQMRPKNLHMNKGVRDPEVRFARAVAPGRVPEFAPHLGPCLIFLGADNGNGYGQFRYNGRNNYAHRYAWERVNGRIPDGLTIDHLCRVRNCVNVEHLELVPGAVNTRRAAAIRDHCPNEHEYTEENTMYRGTSRICIECRKATARRSQERRRKHENWNYDMAAKYPPDLRRHLVNEVAYGRMSVAEAAKQLGCAAKYMDKRVRARRRELGLGDRRPRNGT